MTTFQSAVPRLIKTVGRRANDACDQAILKVAEAAALYEAYQALNSGSVEEIDVEGETYTDEDQIRTAMDELPAGITYSSGWQTRAIRLHATRAMLTMAGGGPTVEFEYAPDDYNAVIVHYYGHERGELDMGPELTELVEGFCRSVCGGILDAAADY